ncbi:MAG TPA: hypothetical protein VFV07_00790 [Rhizomicrobium sp.]|nr:hypothetical protein [Rhizomicrobium sp.]
MAFREKAAWISLIVGIGVYVFYFAQAVPAMARGEAGGGYYFGLLAAMTVLFVIAMIVLTVVAAVFAPKDAKTPLDERERLIGLKASQIAGVVLSAGAFMTIIALFLGAERFFAANFLFLSMAVSETLKSGAQIFYYRRGA